MLGQEHFQSVELLRYTFDVVETINTDNNFDALEPLLESGDAFLD